jgi:hypothetical protein
MNGSMQLPTDSKFIDLGLPKPQSRQGNTSLFDQQQ